MHEQRIPKAADLRRKVFLELLSSPLTVLPFVVGVSAFLGTWALNIRPDLGVLGLVLGILGAGGMFLTQLFTSGEDRAKKAIVEFQEKARAQREADLDELAQRLEGDRDPRTETALSDLRALAKALDGLDEDPRARTTNATVIDIRLTAAHLFSQCVRSLEQSLKLWHTAADMRTVSARQPILDQRETIVEDVYRSIRDLGNLLVALQDLGATEDNASELTRIRNELNQNLKVARKVDARMRDFEHEIDDRLRQ